MVQLPLLPLVTSYQGGGVRVGESGRCQPLDGVPARAWTLAVIGAAALVPPQVS